MSASTKFLLLVIIGIAIAILGSHFAVIFLGITLMLIGYGMPLLITLGLLVLAWRLIIGEGKTPEQKKIEPIKTAKPNTNIPPDPNIEIQRELNRMKHQLGHMNKQKKP